jgi:hypothetical protein
LPHLSSVGAKVKLCRRAPTILMSHRPTAIGHWLPEKNYKTKETRFRTIKKNKKAKKTQKNDTISKTQCKFL